MPCGASAIQQDGLSLRYVPEDKRTPSYALRLRCRIPSHYNTHLKTSVLLGYILQLFSRMGWPCSLFLKKSILLNYT